MAAQQQISKLVEYDDSSSNDELFVAKEPRARKRLEHTESSDDKPAEDGDSSSSDELFIAKKPQPRKPTERAEAGDNKQPVVAEKGQTPKPVTNSDSDEPLLTKLHRRKAKGAVLLAPAEQLGDQGASDSEEPLLATLHRRKTKETVLLAPAGQVGNQGTPAEQGVDESVPQYWEEQYGQLLMLGMDRDGALAEWDQPVADGILQDVPFEVGAFTANDANADAAAAAVNDAHATAAAALPDENVVAELAAFEPAAIPVGLRPPFECIDPRWLTW